ncbi:MAG: NAD(P)/FAD-dependent oxidoreductase, partial [Anaerotignaceae bacterium]
EYSIGTGGMQLIEDKEQWDIISEMAQQQRKSGVDIRMISAQEAREIEPNLTEDIYGALYSPTSGKINPLKLTLGFAHGAKKLGAEFKTYTTVTDIIIEEGAVKGVKTTEGDYYANVVVNACGARAAEVAKLAGFDFPIKARKGQLAVTEPIAHFLDATVQCARYNLIKFRPEAVNDKVALRLGATLSIEQTHDGGFIIGGTREFVDFEEENTFEAIEKMMSRTVRFFPLLKDTNIVRFFSGFRPYTPDGMPLMGEVNGLKGFFMAAGHEGDGIALSPVTGLLLAEQIVYGKPSYNIDAFSPNRFL